MKQVIGIKGIGKITLDSELYVDVAFGDEGHLSKLVKDLNPWEQLYFEPTGKKLPVTRRESMFALMDRDDRYNVSINQVLRDPLVSDTTEFAAVLIESVANDPDFRNEFSDLDLDAIIMDTSNLDLDHAKVIRKAVDQARAGHDMKPVDLTTFRSWIYGLPTTDMDGSKIRKFTLRPKEDTLFALSDRYDRIKAMLEGTPFFKAWEYVSWMHQVEHGDFHGYAKHKTIGSGYRASDKKYMAVGILRDLFGGRVKDRDRFPISIDETLKRRDEEVNEGGLKIMGAPEGNLEIRVVDIVHGYNLRVDEVATRCTDWVLKQQKEALSEGGKQEAQVYDVIGLASSTAIYTFLHEVFSSKLFEEQRFRNYVILDRESAKRLLPDINIYNDYNDLVDVILDEMRTAHKEGNEEITRIYHPEFEGVSTSSVISEARSYQMHIPARLLKAYHISSGHFLRNRLIQNNVATTRLIDLDGNEFTLDDARHGERRYAKFIAKLNKVYDGGATELYPSGMLGISAIASKVTGNIGSLLWKHFNSTHYYGEPEPKIVKEWSSSYQRRQNEFQK